MKQQEYMRRAIELAKKGMGWTNPNPLVGAVIVKDGRIIGEGYHRKCGQLHAERNAIASLTESAEGATIYVTLEPCCHYGKTPPCTEAIIEQKIAKVVIGSRDPNPLVAGKGAQILRKHGIVVEEDFLREECDALNPVFFHYIVTHKPYVVMKYAMTLDGKIATHTGASKWITGETARGHVHELRGHYAAILAGIGTVLADDPMLNCRKEGAHQPLRVIVDSALRIPLDCQICQTAKEYPTVVACAGIFDEEMRKKAAYLREYGIEVEAFPQSLRADDSTVNGSTNKTADESIAAESTENKAAESTENKAAESTENKAAGSTENKAAGRVDLRALMEWLADRKIDSVLIEGGGQIHEAALTAGIVNHVCAYIAPKIFGGEDAKTPVEGDGVLLPDNAAVFTNQKITQLGEDILLEYDITGGMNGVYWNC